MKHSPLRTLAAVAGAMLIALSALAPSVALAADGAVRSTEGGGHLCK